jgi:hypothetical protein
MGSRRLVERGLILLVGVYKCDDGWLLEALHQTLKSNSNQDALLYTYLCFTLCWVISSSSSSTLKCIHSSNRFIGGYQAVHSSLSGAVNFCSTEWNNSCKVLCFYFHRYCTNRQSECDVSIIHQAK